ncbi:hypothetical protein Hanom_Chr08g00731821 [Helianthus anomalus]
MAVFERAHARPPGGKRKAKTAKRTMERKRGRLKKIEDSVGMQRYADEDILERVFVKV